MASVWAIVWCMLLPALGAAQELKSMRYEDSGGRSLAFSDLLDGGSVLLFVNVASFCGFTDVAYKEMQSLHEKYYDAGLRVLAVPSGTFKQEPEEAWKVKEYCEEKFGITFPVLAKVDVNGAKTPDYFRVLKRRVPESCQNTEQRCEMWARMDECSKNPGYMLNGCSLSCGECQVEGGQVAEEEIDIKWNFEKFLVNEDGDVVGRFLTHTSPLAMESVIRAYLYDEEEL